MSKATKRWRDVFAASETLQRIRPAHTDEYINNPHCGWATFQRFNGDPLEPDTSWHDDRGPVVFSKKTPARLTVERYLPTRIAYCRWPWGVLEPEPGHIRFDIIDAALETARRRGQTLQLRTQPFVHADLPEWFIKSGAKLTHTGEHAGRAILEPDGNDPLYIKLWGRHIRALGERYDGHPDLESFDVAYAGRFGEMGGNANPESSRRLVDFYLRAFRKTMLLLMISTHGCRYAAGLGRANVGWRGDGFMDPKFSGKGLMPDGLNWNHMWDVYPVDIFEYGVADMWKTAPMTIEPHATLVHMLDHGGDIDWQLEHCLKYHPSVYMHKSVYIPENVMDKVTAFAKRLGYRFCLHQMTLPLEARPGQRVDTVVTIDNKGVAPIYRPYRFALRFSQGRRSVVVPFKQDIRRWLPDYSSFRESFVVPRGLKKGEAKILCGIIDDRDEPVVRMAIKAVDSDGWHPLTSVDIV